jgi:hypothetical protein
VWLPLPHILLLPFVQVYSWWANGIAGVIPSALAYIAACAGVYRLARHWLAPTPSALALAFFALNPNLLYLQTTAMTEPLFVCEMVWVAVWLVEWRASLDEDPIEPARKTDHLRTPSLRLFFWRKGGKLKTYLGPEQEKIPPLALLDCASADRRHLHALRWLDHGSRGLELHGPGARAPRQIAFAHFLDRQRSYRGRTDCVVCV